MLTVKPFIKWAGGKGQLLGIIREKYPENIKKYCEPFVGGGAVLLDVLANFKPEEVLINDINHELINAYIHIRDNADDMIDSLSDMQEKFWNMNSNQRKEYFYIQRAKFNDGIKNNIHDVSMAVLFIFLNRTCFNGLYRVNRQGFYNVPVGSYRNPHNFVMLSSQEIYIMKKRKLFRVTIEEVISQTFDIYANDIKEASEIIINKYNNGDIILSPGELIFK